MDIIGEIRPQKVIPVHTEHPELFKKVVRFKVIEPRGGKAINV